ncbi:MAG: hypothetical protein WA821_14260 [Anaerolineales bacterium]
MLTPEQSSVIEAPTNCKLFLRGPAGTGKTTAAVERLKFLLQNGVPAGDILILTPQRTLQDPYLDVLHSPEMLPGGEATPATIGGLAKRMVDLFWPLTAEAAGFSHPDQPPVFLTLETAQYYMARIVRPHLEEGWFESVTMDRNRLYSQILDNLNKAASGGFAHSEIGERLSAAWGGDPAQLRVYADAQACASEFRRYCLEHNLLDFSLQLEIFAQVLWNDSAVRDYLTRSYRHLIYDNPEEDIPVAHDLLAEWLPAFDSALIVYDEGGGYRRFLGADPESALGLAVLCDETVTLRESFITNDGLAYLSAALAEVITPSGADAPTGVLQGELAIASARFYPEMLDAVSNEIQLLIEEGTPPGEIVVLAPYLSDALRFSLMNRLEARGIPARSHRPSRSLREEPASQCLLTLAALAHPGWNVHPTAFDFSYMLVQSLDEMDLVRAQLLTKIVFRPRDLVLGTFDQIVPEMQERITYALGGRYTVLREWLEAYRHEAPQPLDHFLRRLFGEVLSQPGFGFHRNFDSAKVAASLIESVQKFRWAMEPVETELRGLGDLGVLGQEYIAMLQDGVIAAQYVAAWNVAPQDAVLLAPAYTFLMSNRPVDVQFWLDAGSGGWVERLFQPLTHPYVLSRHWPRARTWTDADEVDANNATLTRLLNGLLLRCRVKIYLGLTELGESGYEQRGALLRAFNRVLTREENRE